MPSILGAASPIPTLTNSQVLAFMIEQQKLEPKHLDLLWGLSVGEGRHDSEVVLSYSLCQSVLCVPECPLEVHLRMIELVRTLAKPLHRALLEALEHLTRSSIRQQDATVRGTSPRGA